MQAVIYFGARVVDKSAQWAMNQIIACSVVNKHVRSASRCTFRLCVMLLSLCLTCLFILCSYDGWFVSSAAGYHPFAGTTLSRCGVL